jgi:manganese/zinc/iron transport system ATP- binding protein
LTDHEAHLALHIEDLTVAYDGRPVLWDVDLDVPTGVMAAIVGPNGAGKSTLLKAMLGLVKPTAGHVYVLGRPYAEQRARVAYVPQRSGIDWDFPTTVLDVVVMGRYGRLGWLRRPGKAAYDHARQALEQVGMIDFQDRPIARLSGGQQQRTFLARALAQDADVMLLDEPMAGVDATSERAILEVLKNVRSQGRTVLVVHHDLQTVRTTFDWLMLLNVRAIAQGPVDEVYNPTNLEAAYGPQVAFATATHGG